MNEVVVTERCNRFLAERLVPCASLIDSDIRLLEDLIRDAGRLGLLGMHLPSECGGAGLDLAVFIQFLRDVARINASVAMTIVAHSMLSCFPLARHGSQLQKEEYLRPMATGESLAAFALTEPEAGSDVANIKSTAQKCDGGFVLSGHKIFITNAHIAKYLILTAKTDSQNRAGVSLFVVNKALEGVTVVEDRMTTLGMRGADVGEVLLDKVRVPDRSLIGRFGTRTLLETLTHARLGMAAVALGISEAAKAACLEYAGKRVQFGIPLYQHQSISHKLADMELQISAAELLLEKAVKAASTGGDLVLLAAMAKLYCSEAANRITKDAIQIHGARGCSSDRPLERYFRDAKITEIGDGTSEILRDIITGRVMRTRNCSSANR